MKYLHLTLLFLSITAFSQIKIPFTLTDGGHTLVKAKVNGVEGMFIFDTGAGLNMVTKKFANKVTTLQKTDEFTPVTVPQAKLLKPTFGLPRA